MHSHKTFIVEKNMANLLFTWFHLLFITLKNSTNLYCSIWQLCPLKIIRRNLLLSEHILCKESIVIIKKIDFEILTRLYVLRSPEFIYVIFTVMWSCMYFSNFLFICTVPTLLSLPHWKVNCFSRMKLN